MGKKNYKSEQNSNLRHSLSTCCSSQGERYHVIRVVLRRGAACGSIFLNGSVPLTSSAVAEKGGDSIAAAGVVMFCVFVSCFLFYFEGLVSRVLCFPALPVPVSVCPVPDCSFPSPAALSHSSASWLIASPALIVSTCVSLPCVFSVCLLLVLGWIVF